MAEPEKLNNLCDEADDSLVVEIDTTGYNGPADLDVGQDFGNPLLPGWLTERMMHDTWQFGLLTTGGLCLCIETINRVWQAADGGVWLDVIFLSYIPAVPPRWAGLNLVAAPTSRLHGSVNAAHIVAALELGDS